MYFKVSFETPFKDLTHVAITSKTGAKAVSKALEFYAIKYGTTPSYINVVEIKGLEYKSLNYKSYSVNGLKF